MPPLPGQQTMGIVLKAVGLAKGDNTILAETLFDKAVFLPIFSSVSHSICLLFVHFLTARRHRCQIVKNLSFTTCPVCG